MNARTLCFALLALAPLAAGVAACSGTSGGSDLTDSPTDTDSSELKICGASDCGPALGMPAILCSDGSTGGNTGRCIKTKNTACHWEIRSCLAPTPTRPTPASLHRRRPDRSRLGAHGELVDRSGLRDCSEWCG